MLYYWRINKKSLYSFLAIGLVIFVISFFHLKDSKQSLPVQILFNFFIGFGIPFVLYLALFFNSLARFNKVSKLFSHQAVSGLLKNFFEIHETKPMIFFLAELTITGNSNGFPVRIDYDKGKILIRIAIEETLLKSNELKKALRHTDSSLDGLGLVKKLTLAEFLNNKNLLEIIELVTSYLKETGIPPYK